jgi:hypothetical protein
VSSKSEGGLSLWRVGYHADRSASLHWRSTSSATASTTSTAELAETCLREVLADFRPNLSALHRHVERYGPDAAQDFTKQPVTAQWRRQHVLIAALLRLDGPLIDLTDVPARQQIENRHAELLLEYDLPHLDLHEITTSRRAVTQTIAAELYDQAPARSAFPLAWTATLASPSSSGAAQSVRRPTLSRSPTHRRPNSPTSLRRGASRWSPPPEPRRLRRQPGQYRDR